MKMKLLINISVRVFSVLLLLHILAVNTQLDVYLKYVQGNSISKDFDIEKELETKSKSNSENDAEFDELLQILNQIDNKQLLSLETESMSNHNFNFKENTFQLVHFEIPIPPPDTLFI
jgi:hypothetical protein